MMIVDLSCLVLVFAGFVLLALSLPRHYREVRPGQKSLSLDLRRLLRVVGFCLLFSACALCVKSHGMALGLVYWLALLTLAALPLSMSLSYQPQWLSLFFSREVSKRKVLAERVKSGDA